MKWWHQSRSRARKPGCPEDGRVLGEVLGVLHGEVLGVLHGEVLGQGRLEPSRGAVGCSLVWMRLTFSVPVPGRWISPALGGPLSVSMGSGGAGLDWSCLFVCLCTQGCLCCSQSRSPAIWFIMAETVSMSKFVKFEFLSMTLKIERVFEETN